MRARVRAGGPVAFLLALAGCGGISGMDCAEIADRAREISRTQPIQVAEIANPQETARSPADIRCTAQARLADGRTTTLYLRAYEEDGEDKVAYRERPFP
ncbi:hypothetical protein RCO27_02080 [Sphingosinicella sp. LHD-64]|uniref:hypothetical protein n=1 Tax=Sphingosinicella sp. LHD-64 TaxID=3072139 RepID=UPI00280F4E61|nr:hypothetical protein [Sphingosinicella sp. LHD-64]MDQ8755005.1 hypothetical protein [Sphingosinicella sp. LHD-64]